MRCGFLERLSGNTIPMPAPRKIRCRFFRAIFCLLLPVCLSALSAAGQYVIPHPSSRPQGAPASFDLDRDRESLVSLDGLWRFHPGDNPQWSEPSFDDSAWPLLRSDKPWSVQGYPAMGGFAWYRFAITVPRNPPGSLPRSGADHDLL